MCWFELFGTVSENPPLPKTHHGESTLTVHLYASLAMGKSFGISAQNRLTLRVQGTKISLSMKNGTKTSQVSLLLPFFSLSLWISVIGHSHTLVWHPDPK